MSRLKRFIIAIKRFIIALKCFIIAIQRFIIAIKLFNCYKRPKTQSLKVPRLEFALKIRFFEIID